MLRSRPWSFIMKRTYQPKKRKRKRAGRDVLRRRRAKGRKRLTV